MTNPVSISFAATDLDVIANATGRVAVLVEVGASLDLAARRVNRLTKGALQRLADSDGFAKAKPGEVTSLAYPTGMAALAVDVVVLSRRPTVADARKAGVALARARGTADLLLMAGNNSKTAEIAMGLALRGYAFDAHKTPQKDTDEVGSATIMASKPEDVAAAVAPMQAVAEAVHFTRDLVNEPANVLTTTEFANRIEAMTELGLTVEILDEAELETLGMGSLLSVGQGSDSPSKVAIMQWQGGAKDAAPLALIGKGVVFDTGGISLKPAGGMEDMTMDMGGAAVVAGTMRALAARKANANVVGIVGLVENMPSAGATRPGDVVTSMKGDTIEVINTDAEGRLVLCDIMWYAAERFKPAAMIDLATLTGAIIVGLGHERAGVFSNDDAICDQFLKSANAEGEGAWRMPLGREYHDLMKSRVADIKNSGGRVAGSATAAAFLERFVPEGLAWIHLDIAGVASVKSDSKYAPKGATGWGVMALNRLVCDQFEKA